MTRRFTVPATTSIFVVIILSVRNYVYLKPQHALFDLMSEESRTQQRNMTNPTITDSSSIPMTTTSSIPTSSPTTALRSEASTASDTVNSTNATTTPTSMTNETTETRPNNPVCVLPRFYGQHFNRIIETANFLEMAAAENANLMMSATTWGFWFDSWFDREDLYQPLNVVPRRDCIHARKYLPKTAHFHRNFTDGIPNLTRLLPKQSIRQEAESIVRDMLKHNFTNATSFVSVHRRSMDRSNGTDEHCYELASKNDLSNYCLGRNITLEERSRYCTIQYDDVMDDLRIRDAQFNTTFSSLPVVLFSDGQSPHLDNTFPYIDDHNLMVQSWMMTLSVVHYGNPLSSIDYVLNHWRKGRGMRPSACYDGYDEIVAPQLEV